MIGRRRIPLLLAATTLARPAFAQTEKFPAGRVTMVVPFPAGAATDISARIYAERLSALWGQPVVIDNKGGGNGIPAAETVARAKPDGLTIFATSAMTQAVNPAIYDKPLVLGLSHNRLQPPRQAAELRISDAAPWCEIMKEDYPGMNGGGQGY